MDKYEYKVRSEEISKLIQKEKYADAVKIADTIDWRRVKSASMLLKIAALYRISRRNEDSREMLMLAYERYPTNRSVVYSLCELSIELDDVVAAIEYYKQFAKLAPKDNGVYTLRYRILEAQEASLEERIEILEELKKKDYQEEWAYELAYLYHRVGLSTKCVEECDDIILWFGDGPYVMKAMELKAKHVPLTEMQQQNYEIMLGNAGQNYSSGNYGSEEYGAEGYDGQNYGAEGYDGQNYGAEGYDSQEYGAGGYDNPNYDAGRYEAPNYGGVGYGDQNYTGQDYGNQTYDGQGYDAGNYDSQNYDGGNYANQDYDGGNYANQNYDGGNYANQDYTNGNYANPNYDGGNYNNQNYDGGNYDSQNYGVQGYDRQSNNGQNYDTQGYGSTEYNGQYADGYSQEGYAQGQYADGYSQEGYAQGQYADGYSQEGYTQGQYADGYSQGGYAQEPYQEGYAQYAEAPYGQQNYSGAQYEDDAYAQNHLVDDGYGNLSYVDGAYQDNNGYTSEFYVEQTYDENGNLISPDTYEDSAYTQGSYDVSHGGDKKTQNYGKQTDAPRTYRNGLHVVENTAAPAGNSGDMSQYNTINLQKVVAESMKELFPDDNDDVFAEDRAKYNSGETVRDGSGDTRIFAGVYGADKNTSAQPKTTGRVNIAQMVTGVQEKAPEPHTGAIKKVLIPGEDARSIKSDSDIEALRDTTEQTVDDEHARMEYNDENVYHEQRMMGENDAADAPQPTGPMKLDDVLVEWERMKQDNARKHQQEIKKRVLTQTGKIFADFDNSIKSGILGELEREEEEAQRKNQAGAAQRGSDGFLDADETGDIPQQPTSDSDFDVSYVTVQKKPKKTQRPAESIRTGQHAPHSAEAQQGGQEKPVWPEEERYAEGDFSEKVQYADASMSEEDQYADVGMSEGDQYADASMSEEDQYADVDVLDEAQYVGVGISEEGQYADVVIAEEERYANANEEDQAGGVLQASTTKNTCSKKADQIAEEYTKNESVTSVHTDTMLEETGASTQKILIEGVSDELMDHMLAEEETYTGAAEEYTREIHAKESEEYTGKISKKPVEHIGKTNEEFEEYTGEINEESEEYTGKISKEPLEYIKEVSAEDSEVDTEKTYADEIGEYSEEAYEEKTEADIKKAGARNSNTNTNVKYTQASVRYTEEMYAKEPEAYTNKTEVEESETYGEEPAGYTEEIYREQSGGYTEEIYAEDMEAYTEESYAEDTEAYTEESYAEDTEAYTEESYAEGTEAYTEESYAEGMEAYTEETYAEDTVTYTDERYEEDAEVYTGEIYGEDAETYTNEAYSKEPGEYTEEAGANTKEKSKGVHWKHFRKSRAKRHEYTEENNNEGIDVPCAQEEAYHEEYTSGYADEAYREDSYKEDSYREDSYTEDSYGEDSYTEDSYKEDSYREAPYPEDAHEDTYIEDTYTEDPYDGLEDAYSDSTDEPVSVQRRQEYGYQEGDLDPEDAESIAEMAKEDALKTQEIKMNTADLSSLSEKIVATTKKEASGARREEIRDFTPEEQTLFENFAVTKKIKKQIIYALENMTLAAYTGNVIITGDAGLDTIRMAKNLVKEYQSSDEDFSGKLAKITGEKINQRNIKDVFEKLNNGGIIIEKANGMSEEKLYELATNLNQDTLGIVVIMEDTKKEITKLLEKQAMIVDYFNIRIDLMEMDNNALVAYAKNYALALEYSIDELGTLALYTRIANMQSGNHVVTKDEVRDIIDEAIWKSKKSKIKNFVDVLFARRYDNEDMIVLKERDFM